MMGLAKASPFFPRCPPEITSPFNEHYDTISCLRKAAQDCVDNGHEEFSYNQESLEKTMVAGVKAEGLASVLMKSMALQLR